VNVSEWFQYLSGSISRNVSIATYRKGSAVMAWSALAIEVFPELPTPLRRIIWVTALKELLQSNADVAT
jgi:hypothetical protein